MIRGEVWGGFFGVDFGCRKCSVGLGNKVGWVGEFEGGVDRWGGSRGVLGGCRVCDVGYDGWCGCLFRKPYCMLRFSVFDDNGKASEWPLVHAHMLGPEHFGVPSKIRFEDGEIVCQAAGGRPAALALLYDAGGAGRLILQTCLLPDSERPYVLSHELARHRIKTFLAKCEEWQMFELALDHPAIVKWEEARQLFTKGLTAKDAVAMDRFGRESLEKAIESTELLARAHAEVLLHRRFATRPASATTLGVRISAERGPEPFSQLLTKEFDVVYVPLNWRELEPNEGEFNFGPTDRWLTWAKKQKRPVVAGPLLDFSPGVLPEWMNVWKHDYDTCRDMVYDHIERMVMRYGNVVSIWSIAAGVNTNDHFQFTPEQMLDITRMANLNVRQKLRRARTMVEIVQPFGEHVGRNKDSLPPMNYVDRVIQEGIRVDCFGLQMAFGGGAAGLPTRDLMQFSNMLDRFFLLEVPLLLTRVGVPSAAVEDSSGGVSKDGYWHKPWSPSMQSEWLKRALHIAMSKPHVESFFWAELFDHANADIPYIGLADSEIREKMVLKQAVTMRRRMRKPLGQLKQPSELEV